MNKSDLIRRIALRHPQFPAADAEIVVNAILNAMASSLAQGHRIEIRDFGSFRLSHRRPRKARNPKSGARVSVPAKYVPHFRAGKELRERVDKQADQRRPLKQVETA